MEVGELAPYISLGSDDVKAFKEPFPSSAELPTNKPTQMIFAFAQIIQIITLGYFGDHNQLGTNHNQNDMKLSTLRVYSRCANAHDCLGRTMGM